MPGPPIVSFITQAFSILLFDQERRIQKNEEKGLCFCNYLYTRKVKLNMKLPIAFYLKLCQSKGNEHGDWREAVQFKEFSKKNWRADRFDERLYLTVGT